MRAGRRSICSRSSAGSRSRGHRVRLVCSGWPGAPRRGRRSTASRSTRVGGRHSFALLGRRAVRRALAAERPDVLVEDVNKLPLFLASA